MANIESLNNLLNQALTQDVKIAASISKRIYSFCSAIESEVDHAIQRCERGEDGLIRADSISASANAIANIKDLYQDVADTYSLAKLFNASEEQDSARRGFMALWISTSASPYIFAPRNTFTGYTHGSHTMKNYLPFGMSMRYARAYYIVSMALSATHTDALNHWPYAQAYDFASSTGYGWYANKVDYKRVVPFDAIMDCHIHLYNAVSNLKASLPSANKDYSTQKLLLQGSSIPSAQQLVLAQQPFYSLLAQWDDEVAKAIAYLQPDRGIGYDRSSEMYIPLISWGSDIANSISLGAMPHFEAQSNGSEDPPWVGSVYTISQLTSKLNAFRNSIIDAFPTV